MNSLQDTPDIALNLGEIKFKICIVHCYLSVDST